MINEGEKAFFGHQQVHIQRIHAGASDGCGIFNRNQDPVETLIGVCQQRPSVLGFNADVWKFGSFAKHSCNQRMRRLHQNRFCSGFLCEQSLLSGKTFQNEYAFRRRLFMIQPPFRKVMQVVTQRFLLP